MQDFDIFDFHLIHLNLKQKIEKIFTDLRNKALLRQFELASQPAGNEGKSVILN